jgi:hypothetical protein
LELLAKQFTGAAREVVEYDEKRRKPLCEKALAG